MIPSKYQQTVYDDVANITDSLQINAVAGSGKTTTLLEASKIIKGAGRFLAFNKSIADSLKAKAPNLRASTLNGFGWGICLNNAVGPVELDKQKTQKVFSGGLDFANSEDKDFYKRYRGVVNRAIGLFKNLYIVPEEATEESAQQIINQYDLLSQEPKKQGEFERLLRAVVGVYKRCCSITAFMDFDDQIFMPLYLGYNIPKYDWLMVDESQDLNKCNILMVLEAARRLMSVGDPHQSIYGFRGADPKAMQFLKEMSKAKELPLSICYRCAKSIVREAQKIVPHIEYWDESPEGIVDQVKKDPFYKAASDGDYVLCRTNAPLVSACLKFIREGRKATVKGKDVAEQLLSLISELSRDDNSMNTERFWEILKAYQVARTEQLQRVENEDAIEVLNDKIGVLVAILEEVASVGELIAKINAIFNDNATGGIILSSVHKAKGLETKHVWIIEPKTLGKSRGNDPVANRQEQNLFYVGITRAQEHLTYVE